MDNEKIRVDVIFFCHNFDGNGSNWKGSLKYSLPLGRVGG